jgi:tetratricopeptide (TPR) repeat protein
MVQVARQAPEGGPLTAESTTGRWNRLRPRRRGCLTLALGFIVAVGVELGQLHAIQNPSPRDLAGSEVAGRAKADAANEVTSGCAETSLGPVRAMIDKGQLTAALKALEEVALGCAGSAEFHGLMGFVLREKGELPAAAKELYAAVELAPNGSAYYYQLAEILIQNHVYGEARVFLVKANQEFPDQIWTYLFLATVDWRSMVLTEAEAVVRKAIDRCLMSTVWMGF